MASYEVETDQGTYQVDTEDPISKPESFGRGAANNFPLAPQAIAGLSEGNYSQNMADWNAKAAEAKKANPITYGAGAVTGAMAPLAIPGVGEAMAANPITGNALLGAASAVSNRDVLQQPEEAAKDIVKGGLIGGTIGKFMPSGKGVADNLTEVANAKAVQSSGIRPGLLGVSQEELSNLGQKMHELDLVKGSTEERFMKAKDLLHQTGAQIGDIGEGAVLKDASPFVENLHNNLQESASIYGADANPEATIYRQGIANLQKSGLTFDELGQLKAAYGQRAFDANGAVKNDAASNVYHQIKDAMKQIVSDSGEYSDTMGAYSTLHDITSGLKNMLQKEQAGGAQTKGFGMVGKLAGMLGGGHPAVNVGTAAVLAPTHPFMALGALTPIATNPQMMSNIARSGAEAIPKAMTAAAAGTTEGLVSKLHSNPQSFGQYAPALQKAYQDGGNQGVAATHYVLSTTHPEYNKMMLDDQEGDNNNADR